MDACCNQSVFQKTLPHCWALGSLHPASLANRAAAHCDDHVINFRQAECTNETMPPLTKRRPADLRMATPIALVPLPPPRTNPVGAAAARCHRRDATDRCRDAVLALPPKPREGRGGRGGEGWRCRAFFRGGEGGRFRAFFRRAHGV